MRRRSRFARPPEAVDGANPEHQQNKPLHAWSSILDTQNQTTHATTRRDRIGLAILLGFFGGAITLLIGAELIRNWLAGH